MHDTVTNSSTATSHYAAPSNKLLSPISLTAHPSAFKDSFGWFYPHDESVEPSFENWHLSTPDTTIELNTARRPLPATLQKLSISNMPARTENVDRAATANAGRRWRLNSSGQLVDAEAESASWELADEIGRLKIGDVTADTGDARVPIRTPPKSKMPATAVTQIAESSPLDSSSNTSVGSSPHAADHQISHSRGSSADTTISSSRDSITGNTLLTHPPLKGAAPTAEAKERPHSFSGGLSTADLRRLQQVEDPDHDRQLQQQQQQWAGQTQYRENTEQLSYPSLSNQVHRPVPQQPLFNYSNAPAHQPTDRDREDAELEYNPAQQQRNFAPVPPHINHGLVMNPMNPGAPPPPPQFVQGRPNNAISAMNYRQSPRSFPPQGPTLPALGYAGGHHTSHLSLGNTQQLYEMMLPGPPHESHHPAVTRVQQQHNVFRGTHHHSASDPSAIRDVAALQLLTNNMQSFNPSMFQPGMPPPAMALYPNQYYGAQELAVQQVMAARLQAQYTGSYNVTPGSQPHESDVASPTSSSGQTGPSANNRKLGLYKTELCRSWEEKGSCRYGTKCQFAHGEDELRKVTRHPKYKTEICKTFWVSGSCPYGKRCCFIHTELSSVNTPATAGTAENTPPQPQIDGRPRSNSDPDTSSSVSLLTRISRSQQDSANGASTPVDVNSTNSFQFTRPPTGSLRVDTTVLDGAPIKQQNKSAYPSFASNGILLPAPEHIAAKSPAPVTAGPDLGRHNLARMEIVGYPNKNSTSSTSNSNPRHSFNGSEVDLNFSPSPPASGHTYAHNSNDNPQAGPPRVNGHVRAGSAGNWGSISRSSHLSASAYPHGTSAAGEIMSNSPWSSTELALGSSRLHEKTWV
ncbi:hypothetical protein GALMADRAFT_217898 [Galerina marginata CBS 339.88]|uniref:C3H1-type domain-containing protein n=1 Tax=Galerina marginata (strain CBS 339.88) TaxID=685588 RepID=A0A067TNL4_GALM3|nr:hypothetical protein GALMADRAFT_217898 [Galerina marginata CBS 339.88]